MCVLSLAFMMYVLFFQLDHEFIAKGYIMKKGRIKVTVFKMYKVSECTKVIIREDGLQ